MMSKRFSGWLSLDPGSSEAVDTYVARADDDDDEEEEDRDEDEDEDEEDEDDEENEDGDDGYSE